MICGLHLGSIKIFEDSIDIDFVYNSLTFPTYETMCFWQLLAAELQGDADSINNFFGDSQIQGILKVNCKSFFLVFVSSRVLIFKP